MSTRRRVDYEPITSGEENENFFAKSLAEVSGCQESGEADLARDHG